MAKGERIVFAFLADTHVNHALGLMSPKTRLPADPPAGRFYTPGMTPVQEWLWECYMEDIKGLTRFVGKDRLIAFLAGDVCQGNKHKDETVSQRESDQILMAAQALDPLVTMKQLEAMFIVKGTDAHDMLAGSLSTLVAEQLLRYHPEKSIEVAYHPVINIMDLVRVNVSHHGPNYGKRAWIKGNELLWYSKDIIMSNILSGEEPPDIIVRADVHNYALAYPVIVPKEGPSHLALSMILPPYSVANSHARQVAQSPDYVRVGIIAVEVWTSGVINYRPIEFLHTLSLTREVKVA